MRVAVLNDIHGNLDALEAVLSEVRDAAVDRIVVGGDVLPGPMPTETLTRLLNLDVPVQFIHGNGDRVVLAQMRGQEINEVPEAYRDSIRWTAERLDPDHEGVLASWPLTCRLEIPPLGSVLFCHATPRNDREIFTRVTPEDRLAPVFAGVDAPLVVCGHTHMQFDRMAGAVRIVNAGSIGMPFAHPAGAHWLLLGPDVQLRQTSYDVNKAADRIRATGYPQVESVLLRYVLNPPTEAETLQLFAGAELR
jgi:predicted phosphodiesterase